jgi:hypothetical protein
MAGNLDASVYDRLLSSLGKRVFLMHNVHNKQPLLFQTRWAMNYMAGPLTRSQAASLNQLAGVHPVSPSLADTRPTTPARPPVAQAPIATAETVQPGLAAFQPIQRQPARPPEAAPAPSVPGSSTRPAVPNGIAEFFLPNNLSFTQSFKAIGRPYPEKANRVGMVYRPVLLAQASVRFLNRKFNLDTSLVRCALVTTVDRRGVIRWENFLAQPLDQAHLDEVPDPGARFASLEGPLSEGRNLLGLQKDFLDWVFRSGQVTVRTNESLKVYAGPDVTQAEFRQLCSDAARQARDAEARKVNDTYDRKLTLLKDKLKREERELSSDETELSQRKMEEMGTHAENVFNLFRGRSSRRLSTSLSKRRLTEQAKADVEESLQAIEEYKRQISALEKEKEAELARVHERWAEVANQVTETSLAPLKKDVLLELFGVAWFPHHLIEIGAEVVEVPGFGQLTP